MRERDQVIRVVRDDDDDDDEVLRDGESLRTPLYLVDSVRYENHQPHFLRATDSAAIVPKMLGAILL